MECISIMGIGLLSALGKEIDTVWEQLSRSEEVEMQENPFVFDSGIPLMKKKKANRYSEMGIYVTREAIKDSNLQLEDLNKERVGTVFTTGYGPINSALKFSESVVKGDWELCSPVVFANTVNNACIGHICMTFGLKGASTMLMASNNLSYTQLLLNTGKADYILTGAIEEYCEELHSALKAKQTLNSMYLSEAALAFMLKNGKDSNSYCEIVDIFETSIGKYPITERIDKETVSTRMQGMAEKVIKNYEIDAFFSSSNGTYFDAIESDVMHKVLAKDIIYVDSVKEYFGETLGSSLNMNVMVASLCLKHENLPIKLDSEQRKVKRIMVSGYDIAGNYSLVVLQK